MAYIVKFWSDVKDPNDPEYLRIDGAAEKVSIKYGTKIKQGDWSVYTFATKKLAMEFRMTPEHQEAMRNVDKFYHSFKVERNF